MGPSGDMKAEISQKRVVGLVSKETHLEFTMKPRGKLHDNGRVVELRRSPEPFPVTCVPMSPDVSGHMGAECPQLCYH